MSFIGIRSIGCEDHPEFHPNLLYEQLDDFAIADIRRRIALGAKSVSVEVVEPKDSERWHLLVKRNPTGRGK